MPFYIKQSEKIEEKLDKNQGTANVGKILVVGTDGNLVLTDMPEGGTSGDVVGVLDDSNNILLTGALADGTYTLKYENTDGTVTEIGTLEVGEIPEVVEYTNFADPTSEDWVTGGRISNGAANGVQTDAPEAIVTNYIAIQSGDIIQLEGCVTIASHRYAVYSGTTHAYRIYNGSYSTDGDGYATLLANNQLRIDSDAVSYIRLTLVPNDINDLSTVIINIQRNGEWL